MNREELSKKSKWGVLLLIVVFAVTLSLGIVCSAKKGQLMIMNNESLADLLTELKQKCNQPAIAAALVHGDSIIAEAAVGTILYGEERAVDQDSRFHLGSTTKSMTAVLVAMFVKEGILTYATTLEQVLPGMEMRDEYRSVTVSDLLNNKAGIIAFQLTTLEDPAVVEKLMKEIPAAYPDPTEQRREVTRLALSLEPIAEPGTKVIYSNVGWPIIGHILELAAGQSYEDLLKKRIFEPLGMKTARIGGWPASATEPDQPRGHYAGQDKGGLPKPQDLNDEYVLSAWMSPSGGVHCSVHDFALYAREHLLGLQGKGKLLDQEAYKTMHSIQVTTNLREMYPHMKQDREASFGYGWAVTLEKLGYLSSAAGSGGTFFAQIHVYPALNYAFVGFTNCGNGGKALNDLVKKVTGEK
jgi:CubicO group peptidase (beta-lactamase class C family)